MNYEEFVKAVKETFRVPNGSEELLEELFRDTEKAVEFDGDETLTAEGWWDIAMEVLPDCFDYQLQEGK